jgi:DNA-binding MarR family transcriptional regulator
MVDNQVHNYPRENIRSLVFMLSLGIDNKLQSLREGSRYAGVRNSDIIVFMRAFREPATVAEIARSLEVSRQAVHQSVKRLQALKVVELVPQANNNRDKLVSMTERGLHAQKTALDQIVTIENEMAALLGEEGLQTFRKHLGLLAKHFKAQV